MSQYGRACSGQCWAPDSTLLCKGVHISAKHPALKDTQADSTAY